MDKDIAITVENIAKIYRLGVKDEMNENFLGTVFDFIKSPLKNYKTYRSLYKFDDVDLNEQISETDSNTIFALNGVSFDVKKGEVIGIIGRNGAGKSTLLKVLSKITTPTKGHVAVRGRISSLLEVGTGFHPELTGRDNIYLNGTILGMTKKEIDSKFEEIVEFSGMEKFLDTPVKRYSSGMKVRLAFSVAAHLEPEILIIDEVLAVGDAEFQKKCLNKMENVSTQGRTVLFVSHNLPAVLRLCPRSILLKEGKVIKDGPSTEVIPYYLKSQSNDDKLSQKKWENIDQAPGDHKVRLRALEVISETGELIEVADITKPIGLKMTFDVIEDGYLMLPYYNVFNDENVRIFALVDTDPEWRKKKRPKGRYISTAWIPGNLLSEGRLYINPSMKSTGQKDKYFYEQDAVSIQIVDNMEGDSARGDYAGRMGGAVRPLLEWETQYSPDSNLPVS